MKLPEHIFRAYDIRGIYPNEINECGMEHLGKGLGKVFHDRGIKHIVVGRDNRLNSESTTGALIKGLLESGINVNYTGVTTHPAIHYYTFIGFDAAVNVSASHNPNEYTGVKVDFENAKPLYGDELKKLLNIIDKEEYITGHGKFTQHGLNTQYIDMLGHKFRIKNKIKVALNCGGGATSEIAPRALAKIGAYVDPMFCELKNRDTHEIPDPESEDFIKEVVSHTLDSFSDIGIALDGDGDRIGVVDEKGHVYKPDEIMLLLIKHILPKHKGKEVIYDVKSTQSIDTITKQYGGLPRIMPTGRSFMLQEMLEGNAILGVELSGHIFIKDNYFGFDDAIYTACRLVDIIDKEEKPLSVLMEEFPKTVNTPEIKVPCPDTKKFQIIEDIQKNIAGDSRFLNINTLDGIRVKISDTGWFLIRAKNTTPLLCIRFEGKDQSEIEKGMQIVSEILSKYREVDLSSLK